MGKPKSKSGSSNKVQSQGRQIVPGITISKKNEATVAPELADVLFDLGLKLEEKTDLPVDVQHVLAAIVMSAQAGEIDSEEPVIATDDELVSKLSRFVRVLFEQLGGSEL